MKICPENPNLFKSKQEYRALHIKILVHFIVAGDIKLS
jgi:hypothetical protein